MQMRQATQKRLHKESSPRVPARRRVASRPELASCEVKLDTVQAQRNIYLEASIIILCAAIFWVSKLKVRLYECLESKDD